MKFKFSIFSILVSTVLLVQCSTVDVALLRPETQARSISKPIQKLAIFNLPIQGAGFGDELADALGMYLIKETNLEIIEREQLSKIVKEQTFSKSGIIDQETASKIGKVLGVDAIVLGRGQVLKIKDENGQPVDNLLDTFSLKIVHIETGSVYLQARKAPGINWTGWYRTKYLLGLGLIWSRKDILIDSSYYDVVAKTIARKIRKELESPSSDKGIDLDF